MSLRLAPPGGPVSDEPGFVHAVVHRLGILVEESRAHLAGEGEGSCARERNGLQRLSSAMRIMPLVTAAR